MKQGMLLGALLSTGVVLATGPAGAVTKKRSFVQNATGSCQSALPAYEGQIRKRPLALQNEGTASAFVTCSFMGTDAAVSGVTEIYLYADNNTNAAISTTCTLVTGVSGAGTQEYIAKTLTLPANSKTNEYKWVAVDHGGQPYTNLTTNVSCNVPAGVGLTTSFVYYDEDVGS